METNILKSPYDIYKYVPKVRIDEGVFKYVQIKAYFKTSKKKLRFVRGYTRFGLHADIYEDFLSEFKISDLRNMSIQGKKGSPMKVLDAVEFKCKGGGRIAHSSM
jgi:Janus/Ocnus family (Ocnus).